MKPGANLLRALNFGGLAASYGLGQGSVFVAQTYLLGNGELSLLAQFAVHFSFAALATTIVEAGSVTVLARRAVSAIAAGEPDTL